MPTDPQDIEDALAENAIGPARVQGDEGEVQQHSLKDQMAVADRAQAQSGAAKPHRGLRFTRLIPPGAV